MVTNVLQYLEKNVNEMPDKIAISIDGRGYSYSKYVDHAKMIATFIFEFTDRLKDRKNNPIAVLIDRNISSIVAFIGCAYSGNFYVPIDPLLPPERIALIISQIDPICIIDAREKGDNWDGSTKVEDIIRDGRIDASKIDEIMEEMIDTDPLYAIFTSGSTGIPKGVLVSHRSVIDLVEEFKDTFGFNSKLIFGNQAPFDFDVSVKDIYGSLCCGGSIVIVPRRFFMQPVNLVKYIVDNKINTLIWAVSALRIISEFDTFANGIVPNLKFVMFSGECMPVKSLNYLIKYIKEATFVNLYGPTEITCNCTYYEVKKKPFPEYSSLPIGIPFKNTRILLIGDNGLLITEANQKGEICVAGSSLALGYFNNTIRTDESFVQNPFITGYRSLIYKTGDIGYFNSDHQLLFSSRKDFQIKHMGHRIELGELEANINSMPFIDVCCCIFDEQEGKILCFFSSKDADSRMIISALKKKLPKYMWPNKYIKREILPMTKNGKIDRRELVLSMEKDI